MAYYSQHRMEMALPKALDLERVGHPYEALEVLYAALTQKHRTKVWSVTLEDTVMKFIELAARLRFKYYELRSVLLQYRSSTQANMTSFVKVLRHLLREAERNVGTGLAVALAQDDDYEDDTPEAISHFAFCAPDEIKTRQNRVRANPAVRFLWDAYRVVLEVLRGNLKLQDLYHDVMRTVFSLCAKYKRKNDFRRFAGYLRDHTEMLPPLGSAAPGSDVATLTVEVQAQLLSTRLAQLTTASELELWNETYTCIKDIHDTLALTYRAGGSVPSLAASGAASTLLQIYDKLASYFNGSKNRLFHAYTLLKLAKLAAEVPDALTATTTTKEETPEGETAAPEAAAPASTGVPSLLNVDEPTRIAAVVLAALSTDPASAPEPTDAYAAALNASTGSDSSVLPALLGFHGGAVPSRAGLFAQIVADGFVARAPAAVSKLFSLIESATSPLRLARAAVPLLEEIKSSPLLATFIPALEQVIAVRILHRAAAIYTVVSIDHLVSMMPAGFDWPRVERLILDTTIVAAANPAAGPVAASAPAPTTATMRIDHRDRVVYLFSDSTQAVTHQLSDLASALTRICDIVAPTDAKVAEDERAGVFRDIRQGASTEAQMLAERRQLLNNRRDGDRLAAEAKEAARVQAAEEERKRRAEHEAAILSAKEKQIEEEERRRAAEERAAVQRKAVAETIAKTMAELPAEMQDNKAARKMQQLANNLDLSKQAELIEASRRLLIQQKLEKERRLVEERKTVDYTARAIRGIDSERIAAAQAETEVKAKAEYEEAVNAFKAKHKAAWQAAVAEKQRLSRIEPRRAVFAAAVLQRLEASYAEELAKYEAAYAEYQAAVDAENARLEEERAARRAKEAEERAAKEAAEAAARKLKEEEEAKQRAAAGPGVYRPPGRR